MPLNPYVAFMLVALVAGIVVSVVYGVKKFKARTPNERQALLMQQLRDERFLYRSTSGKLELPYRLYMPEHATGDEPLLPLILVLHASPGRGDNNFSQLSPGVEVLVSEQMQSLAKSVVVVPQCPSGYEWTDLNAMSPPYDNYPMAGTTVSIRFKAIVALLQDLATRFPIDRQRFYITGMSMGGSATWQFLYHYPDVFAAAIPLNGRTDPAQAAVIGRTPLWMFHGVRDRVAPLQNSRDMAVALDKAGIAYRYTELQAGHGIEIKSYTPEAYLWLLNHKNSNARL